MAIVISGVNNNDKITASDGLIDLLSGVNYAGIITAPGITASNYVTAANINVGNNIKLGNAGVATATTFVGNLTGNVNATSNLLLQIGGSEKFRVGSSGQLGIAGANYGTSGQVLTSGGSGSAATWSTISGTTINNNANYRLISGDANANELNAESNLIFTGTRLGLNNTSPTPLNGDGTGMISVAGGNPEVVLVRTTSGTEAKASIRVTDGEDFKIAVKDGSGSTIDAFAIDTGTGNATFSGDVQIDGDELFIADSIKHVGDTNTSLSFPSNDTITFRTSNTERFRLTPAGTAFVKAAGTEPVNQAEAGHYASSGYNAGHALGLMVKRAIHVSDADTKGVGAMMLSHTRNVACNGTTYNMFTLHNREGTFVGDIYVGFSGSSSGAVRHYKFTCLYNTNNLTSVDFNRISNNDNLFCNIVSSNTSHFFQVNPTKSGGAVERVHMTIIGAACGRNDGAGGDFYTVSYN